MTVLFKTLETEIDLEALPEYEGTKQRFLEGFPHFVREKKIAAVIKALEEELGNDIVLKDPKLVMAVSQRVDDSALVEKPYVFISVDTAPADANPKMLI